MLVKPTVSDLLKKVDNRFKLVVVTSKRARQLSDGSPLKTKENDRSVVTLAADEIIEGEVTKVEE